MGVQSIFVPPGARNRACNGGSKSAASCEGTCICTISTSFQALKRLSMCRPHQPLWEVCQAATWVHGSEVQRPHPRAAGLDRHQKNHEGLLIQSKQQGESTAFHILLYCLVLHFS